MAIHVPTDFEGLPTTEIANLLRQFYGTLKRTNGKMYKKTSVINIRASINCHLTSPPHNRLLNINMHDREFMCANQVLGSVIKMMKKAGLDTSQHKSPILPGDIKKLYDSGTQSNENPKALQCKVFLELLLYFGRRGKEGLWELKKDSFEVREDDKGQKHLTMAYNENDKNHPGGVIEKENKTQLMYAQPGDPRCPVVSFQKYLEKLNPLHVAFFQRPKSKKPLDGEPWYENRPIGVNYLSKMMKVMSEDAKLSKMYTNHCLRATSATVLADAGVEARDICAVTGHHNAGSLKSYVTATSLEKRSKMSNILHNYGMENGQGETSGQIDDRSRPNEVSSLVLSQSTSTSSFANPLATESATSRETTLVSREFHSGVQAANSLFVGANFNAPTNFVININK